MGFFDNYTVEMDVARVGARAFIDKDTGEHGVIQIEAPTLRNVFVIAATIEGVSPGAYFEKRGADTVTIAASVLPIANGEFGGRLEHTAVATAGRTATVPDGDSMYMPSNGPDTKNAVIYTFAFPLVIEAGAFFRMVCGMADAEVTYSVEWLEIPVGC